ncbi:hypothetical protein WICPIJ_003752 [Wickerhamomyces pijperi]|uniref:Metal-dependent protein hydrolase n=1 Tax=Wickerhamomyces pijperi TaxID=599730 RepID=A0A9P8TMQ8_WICPI|nr:hypothetical protein WICPIJ_003752 [Wickerhamomyces pijperi]
MSSEPELKKQKTEETMSAEPVQALNICTHSGSFHADESLAVYMLRLLPRYGRGELTRSRDPKDWEAADIVVDVGAVYDGVKFFDHHQRGFTETFDDKHSTKLSSAGLIYKHFGKEIITQLTSVKEEAVLDLLHVKIYEDFIEAIDANDNGINKFETEHPSAPRFKDRAITLPSIVSNLNPLWNEDNSDAAFDAKFSIACQIMGNVFVDVVKNVGLSWLPAKQIVLQTINRRLEDHKSGKILIFDQFVPWKEHLFELEKELGIEGEILYALFEDSGKNWRIAAVPKAASSFESRKALPEKWRGLRDDVLSEASGVEGCVFIHAAGFIGGAKTKEAVLKLAELSL